MQVSKVKLKKYKETNRFFGRTHNSFAVANGRKHNHLPEVLVWAMILRDLMQR